MEPTQPYAIAQFIADTRRIMRAAGDDRAAIVAQLTPLVERVVWDDGLMDPALRSEPPGDRPRYIHYQEPDGSLQIYVVEFAPGMPTPVHDHVTWGLIGVCGGAQRTTRYRRVDDGSDPERATLEVLEDTILERGAVYPLLPPDDIHRIETVGDAPSYSLHVLGTDLRRQHRHIFDVESGRITAVAGRGM
ncbi:MAG: cysteine dioxygenase family protein [Sphaerobacter sp.]|nr:cysteine dioxygenase family protein [Sphaerobacter sp.]